MSKDNRYTIRQLRQAWGAGRYSSEEEVRVLKDDLLIESDITTHDEWWQMTEEIW